MLFNVFIVLPFGFQDMVIQQDDEIRVKVVGTRVDATDIVSFVQRI